MSLQMPGIELIRAKFLGLLKDRTNTAVAAVIEVVEMTDRNAQQTHLDTARSVFHNLAGTAGCVGLGKIGIAASRCEAEIIKLQATGSQASTDTLVKEVSAFVQIAQESH